MTLPTLHLNGTGKKALAEQLEAAVSALDAALEVMNQAAPHARDYYPQGPAAYGKAEDEHVARMTRVAGARWELMAIWTYLEDQP